MTIDDDLRENSGVFGLILLVFFFTKESDITS